MAETVRGVLALQEELEKAKESLKDVDENIKKLTGREPGQNRPGGPPGRRPSGGLDRSLDRGGGRLFMAARRGLPGGDGPPVKRRAIGGLSSRLGPRPSDRRSQEGRDSGDEEDLPHKPSVPSSVVAPPKEVRSRQASIETLNKDKKGQARNRRMFGLLLGTLQKFKDDSKVNTEKEEKRKEIEHKLEEKEKEERAELREERRTLFSERRQKQTKLRRLEQKMEIVAAHEKWEDETKKMALFIRTKAKPPIFYLPKRSNKATEERMRDTAEVIADMILERRQKLEKEIKELTSEDSKADKENAAMDEDEDENDEDHLNESQGSRSSRDKSESEKNRGGDRTVDRERKESESSSVKGTSNEKRGEEKDEDMETGNTKDDGKGVEDDGKGSEDDGKDAEEGKVESQSKKKRHRSRTSSEGKSGQTKIAEDAKMDQMGTGDQRVTDVEDGEVREDDEVQEGRDSREGIEMAQEAMETE